MGMEAPNDISQRSQRRHSCRSISSADELMDMSVSSRSIKRSLIRRKNRNGISSSAKIYPASTSNLILYRNHHGNASPNKLSRALLTRRSGSGKLRGSSLHHLTSCTTTSKQNEDWGEMTQNEDWDMTILPPNNDKFDQSHAPPIVSSPIHSSMRTPDRATSSEDATSTRCPTTQIDSNILWGPIRIVAPIISQSPFPMTNQSLHNIYVPKSSMKDDAKKINTAARHRDTTPRLHVKFSTAQVEVIGTTPYNLLPNPSSAWHTPQDNDVSLHSANLHAAKIDRVMQYASETAGERTYNSSTGLTSPQVLKEYLSCPYELIGVEYLLSAQKSIREWLKINVTNAVIDEQKEEQERVRVLQRGGWGGGLKQAQDKRGDDMHLLTILAVGSNARSDADSNGSLSSSIHPPKRSVSFTFSERSSSSIENQKDPQVQLKHLQVVNYSERVSNLSTMSTHMALERAAYINLLD